MSARPLDQMPIAELKGVGPAIAQKLQRLGVHSVQDLLFHLPRAYQDRTRVQPIGGIAPGQEVVIEGEIRAADVVQGRRRSLLCRLQDGTGLISLRFFHFNPAQRQALSPGTRVRCFGEVRRGSSGLELYHPEVRRLAEDGSAGVEERLTALYPSTEGLTQHSWRRLQAQALRELRGRQLDDWLPEGAAGAFNLADALQYLHAPPPEADIAQLNAGQHPCQQRLAFEELLAHHLSLLRVREQGRAHAAPAMRWPDELMARFLAALPFSPTGAQQRVVQEIAADLAGSAPMLRLVQGDVGSGKTLVAALSALVAIGNGWQVALMAPTELLAEQHAQAFARWFEPLGLRVAYLSGRSKAKEPLRQIAEGEVQLVVGTHALFQARVSFQRLGLVIVDEQHRFGVQQRLSLWEKGGEQLRPHQLVMTATPIPRTLAMVAYADLDCSVIDELPPGRTPITTVAVDNARRMEVIEKVWRACREEGRQAYWVCTLIEESEVLECQAAEATFAEICEALPDLRVGLVHGRMPAKDKAATMASFKAGELDLLIATTVIEVGVDVPNASLMIIENPERLGLAQLHQLRGRVGRGAAASHCVLMYQSPLGQQGKARLQALRESNDGFFIAERDLELRGPGEVLGTRQTGLLVFRIADMQRDEAMLDDVRASAHAMLQHSPERVEPLVRRWLPEAERFARV